MSMDYWTVQGFGYDLADVVFDRNIYVEWVGNRLMTLESDGRLKNLTGFSTVSELKDEYGSIESYELEHYDAMDNQGAKPFLCDLLKLSICDAFGSAIANRFDYAVMYGGDVEIFAVFPSLVYPFDDVPKHINFDKDAVFSFIENLFVEMGAPAGSVPQASEHVGYDFG